MTNKAFEVPELEDLVDPIDPMATFPMASFGRQLARGADQIWNITEVAVHRESEIIWPSGHVTIKNVALQHGFTLVASADPLDSFEDELEAAVGSIPTESDDPEFRVPSPDVRKLSKRFIRSLAQSMFERGRLIPMPSLEIVADGGLDIHWTEGDSELYVNVPSNADESRLSYYGYTKDRAAMAKGTLREGDSDDFLIVWLIER